jgi:hypothetical protein
VLLCISGGSFASDVSPARFADVPFTCEQSLAPDLLVIAGGVSAQSVNPAESGAQVDRRLANIKTYVTTLRGTVVLLDRLRGARNPDPQSRNEGKSALPFIQIQRLEVVLPVGTNVDLTLENLFKLGVDRYGKNVRLDSYSDQNFSALTGYRISNLKVRLEGFVQRCQSEKTKLPCGGSQNCASTLSYGTITARHQTEEGPQVMTFTLNGAPIKLASSTIDKFESSSAAAISFVFEGRFSIDSNRGQ